MRLFAAISPPDRTRDALERLQEGLPENRRAPWENLHLTLAFFGEVDQHDAEDLDAALDRVRFFPFEVRLSGVGAFGGDRPRLIYAAVEPSPPLAALQRSVSEAARAAGVEVEARRYTPHITLARLPGRPVDERLARWLAGAAVFMDAPFEVEAFSLYLSRLGRGAAHYEALADYPAAGVAGPE